MPEADGAIGIGGIFGKVLKGLKRKRLSEEEMAAAWKRAVGARAARHTMPVSLRKARLVVNVDRSSWLYELSLKRAEIVAGLEEAIGSKKVKEIRFRIGEVRKEEPVKTVRRESPAHGGEDRG